MLAVYSIVIEDIKINIIRVPIDENSILTGPTKEEIKNYQGKKEDLNYYISNKKYDQLEEFVQSLEGITKKIINPLFNPEETKRFLIPNKIKNKSKGRFSNFILVEDLIDYVCKKNRIKRDEISKEFFLEMEGKVRDHNLIIRRIYLKELILKILNPAISRVFMEDLFTEDEKNQIASKNFYKRGPKNLEFLFHYDRAFNRKENQIYWNQLIQKCSFFKINSGEEILAQTGMEIDRVPIDRNNFFVGGYGDSPGGSFFEVDRERRKIYISINKEIFKASSLNLQGDDYNFFISMVNEITGNKISLKINDWEIEISEIEINSFFKKIRSLREGLKWKKTDNDYSYSDPTSFFLNSMFATGNYAYKNATIFSLSEIEKIGNKIEEFFPFEGSQEVPLNKKGTVVISDFTINLREIAESQINKILEKEGVRGEKMEELKKNMMDSIFSNPE
jgi:hypothetical protein